MQGKQLWGWSDANSKLTPAQRMNRAIAAFEEKYGTLPAFCLVHPATITGLEGQQVGCAVYGTPDVPKAAYYFGAPGETL